MAALAKKATVTIGGVEVAANAGTSWRFTTGTRPYMTVMSVHTSVWESSLKSQMGKPVNLVIRDGRGHTNTIREIYILHTIASDGPKRTSFVVADRRWKWPYILVARDYNVPKKSGDRTAYNNVPIENQVVIDEYEYRPYSLNNGEKWVAKKAVEDVLRQLEPDVPRKGGKAKQGKWQIESFPIREGAEGDEGQFTLQNVVLRDQGDVALSRLLSFIPGAEVYIDTNGYARVFDASDLDRLERYYNDLPPSTWDGEKAQFIERTHIRPSAVNVHYQREVEVALSYEDDYTSNTSADPDRDAPYLENVIPTVDRRTTVTEYDPHEGKTVTKTDLPPGTWVNFKSWLSAMDAIKPEGSLPWTFETISIHWLKGDLEGVLGGGASRGVPDNDPEANVASRVQKIREHFRQTFRLNRRYVERLRDIQAVRVALLDPVTGARAPATVWGEICIVPTDKGHRVASRRDPDRAAVYRNVSTLPEDNDDLIETTPGPGRIQMVDRDLGIFTVSYSVGPYGLTGSIVPCNTVNAFNIVDSVQRNLSEQDKGIMGAGIRMADANNGIYLKGKMELKVMLTIIPAAPNNKSQFHVRQVLAEDIKDTFRTEFRILRGQGPLLDVYIPPGEATARYSWVDDNQANETVVRLLGLNSDNPNDAGLIDDPETEEDESQMLGFQMANQDREVSGHSKAVAAEMLASFADNLQGRVTTRMPHAGIFLRGNMSGATIAVGAYPSAKVSVLHDFPGQQKPISRMSLMSDDTRRLVLGIVPFTQGDK